ncbi:MAG: hypothetical protein CL764_05835 [Chloroflexi bacterium]|nr:hypothetical protein [Chloroflexota bacterium]
MCRRFDSALRHLILKIILFTNLKDFFSSKTGLQAFESKEYRYFWLAAAFSNIGMWSLGYGRLWLMHDLTESTIMVGLVGFCTLSPMIIFSFFGGVIADRVNRLTNIRLTRGLFSLLALITGITISIEFMTPSILLFISVLTGILLSFDLPSRSAMLPALVKQKLLSSAIAMYSIVFGISSILGPMIFVPINNVMGIQGIFYLIGSCYIFTLLCLLKMNSSLHKTKAQTENVLSNLKDGLSYVFKSKTIKYVILLGVFLTIFSSSFDTLLPKLSEEMSEKGIKAYSNLLLGSGFGGLSATLFLIFFGTRIKIQNYYIISAILLGFSFIFLSLTSYLLLGIFITFILGGTKTLYGTLSTTLTQNLTDDIYRGRVMSMHQLIWSATAIGSIFSGFLAKSIGLSITIGLSGFFIIICGLIFGKKIIKNIS